MLALVTILASIWANKADSKYSKIRLNEVVHSIFYAPQYVAIEKDYFKDEGLKVDLSTGWGADKSMTALISDNADIALMGPEASIYVYNQGKEDYAVNFAQLTQRAGNFLIGREPVENFNWDMVKGKTIIGGRPGGMPQMVLEYILKQKGIEPFEDVDIITNIDFTATGGAFVGGTGDYTAEFEPSASKLENEGSSYVVTSLGVDSGKVPYTGYMARKSYIEDNKDTIQKFTNAIYKGQLWVEKSTPEEIAKVIKPYFKDTDIELLTQIVKRYKDQDTWKTDPLLEEEGLNLLQNILDSSGELSKRVKYEDLVTTDFANTAIDEIDTDSVK
jgi:NitT/TauT family transport system substrate-binding protein